MMRQNGVGRGIGWMLAAAMCCGASAPMAHAQGDPTGAAALVVTRTDDVVAADGTISLREAVTTANLNSGSTITFDPTVFGSAQTIVLNSSGLTIAQNVTIAGPGAKRLTVKESDTSQSFSLFVVDGGINATLSGFTISNGSNGLFNTGTATLNNCSLSGNGTGIFNGGDGTVILTHCTVSGNNSSDSSSGIFSGGMVNATNCTLSGNGYGLFSGGTATLTNCTLSGNSKDGLFSGGTTTLKNSLVVGNTNSNVFGGFTDGGNNITSGTAADAGLEVDSSGNPVLKDNGGPTLTIALVSKSGTAVNAGNNNLIPSGVTTDQRGAVRIQDNIVDIGAFEFANIAPVNLSLDPTNAVNAPDELRTFTATYSDPDGVGDLAQVYIRFSANNRSTNAIVARYDVQADKLFLLNDDASAFLGGFAPGSANIVSNSQGKFLINRTLVTRTANTLSVTWTFTAKGAPTGLKLNIGLRGEDTLGLSDPVTPSQPAPRPFESFGTWMIQNNRAPSNVSLAPTQAANNPNEERIFTATYSDPDGFKNLSQVRLRIRGTNSRSLADDLVGVYNVQSNELFLVNDRGNGFVRATGVRPGTGSAQSNTRGSLNPRTTTVTRNGNTLTIAWALSASSNFTGTHPVQLFCIDMGGLKDDYQTLGSFVVGASSGAASRSNVSTASASGNGITLVFAGVAPQSGYAVAVNGAPVEVTSASVQGSKVSLSLGASLHAGDAIVVTWNGGSTTLTAG